MLNETFRAVLAHEGVVSIVTWGREEPHVVCTWNSYIRITEDERLLVPVGGMRETQKNVDVNNRVKMTLGSREVMGMRSMGTGFAIAGTARFLESGQEYELMKERFPWLRAVLEVNVTSIKQTL